MDEKVPMTRPMRQTVLLLMGAFVASIGVFCVLVLMLESQRTANPSLTRNVDAGAMRPVCYVIGIALGALSALWATQQLAKAKHAGELQTQMILCFAFAEAACVFGLLLYFLQRKPAEFWPFAALAVVVELLFIVPRVLEYPLETR